jgi:hypothetical protein
MINFTIGAASSVNHSKKNLADMAGVNCGTAVHCPKKSSLRPTGGNLKDAIKPGSSVC